jgi:hypothetical protein
MTLKLLPQKERDSITKEDVIEFEMNLIQYLSFDLNFESPLTYLERFLRLLNV